MTQFRRIACISTSRADAGIYRPLLRALAADSRFEPIVISSGEAAALQELSGIQVFQLAHAPSTDDAAGVAAASARTLESVAKALLDARADLAFVLGDRTEMLAAALAATICTVPIAHLHGGDTTRGAYDDACRHAITKLAHVHFPALDDHARVLRALGEAKERIHVVGALAVDELTRFRAEPVAETSAAIGLDLTRPTLMVIVHPETLGVMDANAQIDRVVKSLDHWKGQIVWIGPNADVGHGTIRRAMTSVANQSEAVVCLESLDQSRFWNCLTHCRALVGNSSAGLLEAASLCRPVVNIGRRQEGRVRGANVIDVDFDSAKIVAAIHRATSNEFTKSLDTMTNPYGTGDAALRIIAVLAGLPERLTLLRKPSPGASS